MFAILPTVIIEHWPPFPMSFSSVYINNALQSPSAQPSPKAERVMKLCNKLLVAAEKKGRSGGEGFGGDVAGLRKNSLWMEKFLQLFSVSKLFGVGKASLLRGRLLLSRPDRIKL